MRLCLTGALAESTAHSVRGGQRHGATVAARVPSAERLTAPLVEGGVSLQLVRAGRRKARLAVPRLVPIGGCEGDADVVPLGHARSRHWVLASCDPDARPSQRPEWRSVYVGRDDDNRRLVADVPGNGYAQADEVRHNDLSGKRLLHQGRVRATRPGTDPSGLG